MNKQTIGIFTAVLLVCVFPHTYGAEGAWTDNGLLICNANSNQENPAISPDGAGGIFVCWNDYRNYSDNNIYLQRVNSVGTPLWENGSSNQGVSVCSAANHQLFPQVLADGSDGAFVIWMDQRGGTNYDIYAQRVNGSGTALWAANGVAIKSGLTAPSFGHYMEMISDNAGGIIVAWQDLRSGSDFKIYAQRINSSGTALWTANGVALATAANGQYSPKLISDGSHGAFVVWEDYRNGNYDIYGQHIDASGVLQWTAAGAAVCTATNNQQYSQMASDGAGGLLVTWQDYRSGSNFDIYAQRLNASGVAQWTANGLAVCTAAYAQQNPRIAADGLGGGIIAWEDYRSNTNYDMYAQRIDSAGAVQWTSSGVLLCNEASSSAQVNPQIAADGNSGAAVMWEDSRSGNKDIYGQRITLNGGLLWDPAGAILCDATGDQDSLLLFSASARGEFAVWRDLRDGTADVYVQNLIKPKAQVASIAPTTAQQGTNLSYTLTGQCFLDDRGSVTSAKLKRAGQAEIFATNIVCIDNQHLTCNFDLTGAYTSTYRVFAIDSLGQLPDTSSVLLTILYSTPTSTVTVSPTITPTPTATPSKTASTTMTATPTASQSPTATVSQTPSITPTLTESATSSPTHTTSPTATESGTFTPTFTITLTATISPTGTISPTATESSTASPTRTHSVTASITPTSTATPTITFSPTDTAVISVTPTRTPVIYSPTATQIPSNTITATPSSTRNALAEVDLTAQLFMAYPNPARERVLFVTHTVDHPATLKVVVYNLSGERVAEIQTQLATGRGQTAVWDCSDMAPGFYLARLFLDSREFGYCKIAIVR